MLLAPPHIHSPSNSKWGKYITGRRIKLNWRCLWLERILQSPFNNVILYFIRVVNRPIEDVMVEYDKTLLSGRHIHSLFDLILYATCRVLLYSVLSCIAEAGAKTKTIQKFAGEQYSFKRRSTRSFVITEKAPTSAFKFQTLLRHYTLC